ncbi:MAG: FAD-binding oxidoreductase [Blastocatellia bacterium]
MSKPQTDLTATFAGVVGSANILANPALSLDGIAPALLVKPASAREAADCLRLCAERRIAVVPAGRAMWLECGNPLRRADVVLSLERMSRIVDYSAPDLTVTVEAGMTLNELNEKTGRDRLWLPLDPPGAAASVGAVVACNSSGALRGGYGTPRDYVIGLKLAHADGSESKSGGRVVKNVAGYDLNKLYVGSYGTLAVITEATFKLRPLPERSVTIALTQKQPERLTSLARQIRASELQPVAFVLASTPVVERLGLRNAATALLLRFADNEAAVTHQVNWLRQTCGIEREVDEVTGDAESALWTRINNMADESAAVIRMSVPLAQTAVACERMLEEGETAITADFSSGIIRAACSGNDDEVVCAMKGWRAMAQELGGTLFIEKAPLVVKQQVDAWGEVGASERLMKALKEKFDPQGILNPGRFVASI